MSLPNTYLQLQSYLTSEGDLHLKLASVDIPPLGPEDVLIRVEAAPINPSDIGAMIGPADVTRIASKGLNRRAHVVLPVPGEAMPRVAAKIGQTLLTGIEGAGVVVSAGSAASAQRLVGKVVSLSTGAMYSQYRLAAAIDVLVHENGTTPIQAASSFINPMTALGMVETMRREGHSALIHTAAASSLGQMLNRLCLTDDIPLVSIVRSSEQFEILAAIGAKHVVDTSSSTFPTDLKNAIAETNATICFDVVGGGPLLSEVLTAMEVVQVASLAGHQRYGSNVHKQGYICGLLDTRPTELTHSFGMAWSVGGWLLTNFLSDLSADEVARLKRRVASEIGTTFASSYARQISLIEALDPEVIRLYSSRKTGHKYLISPNV